MFRIRKDLERVRILLEIIKKRERAKKEVLETMARSMDAEDDPDGYTMKSILESLER